MARYRNRTRRIKNRQGFPKYGKYGRIYYRVSRGGIRL